MLGNSLINMLLIDKEIFGINVSGAAQTKVM
jgi:hypothetical protein